MIGLYLLALLVIYAFIFSYINKFLLKHCSGKKIRAGVSLAIGFIAVAILVGDELIGRVYFDQVYCDKESGLHVIKKGEPGQGLWIEKYTLSDAAVKQILAKSTVQFIEVDADAHVSNYQLDLQGNITTSAPQNSRARYSLTREQFLDNPQMRRDAFVIRDRTTKELLGEYARIIFVGGWIQRRILPFSAMHSCAPEWNSLTERLTLALSVFPPDVSVAK